MCVNYGHTLFPTHRPPIKHSLGIMPFWNQKTKANSALDISKSGVGIPCLKQGLTWAMGLSKTSHLF
jgi:hypothetical protein